MSKPASKMDLSAQAKKIVEQHVQAIDVAGDEAAKKLTSAASIGPPSPDASRRASNAARRVRPARMPA